MNCTDVLIPLQKGEIVFRVLGMVSKKIAQVLGSNCSDKMSILLKLPKLQVNTVDFLLNLSRQVVTMWSVHIKNT